MFLLNASEAAVDYGVHLSRVLPVNKEFIRSRAKSILAITLSMSVGLPIMLNIQDGYAQSPTPTESSTPSQSSTPILSASDKEAVLSWISNQLIDAKVPSCRKPSYGRGVGKPISVCNADEERRGALCYPKCRSGYSSDPALPFVCTEDCPEGFTSSGVATCLRPTRTQPVSRGNCPGGYRTYPLTCTNWRTLKTISRPSSCPDGWRNDGTTCWLDVKTVSRNTYTRGAGTPLKCAEGLESNDGLCYQKCREGWSGRGPVCWQNCGSGRLSCLTSCTQTAKDCWDTMAGQTTAIAGVLKNGLGGDIAGMLGDVQSTFDAYLNVFDAAQNSQLLAQKRRDLEYALNAFGDNYVRFLNFYEPGIASTLRRKLGEDGFQWIAKEFGKSYALATIDALEKQIEKEVLQTLATIVDPTGIAAVVKAFNEPLCRSSDFPSVTVRSRGN